MVGQWSRRGKVAAQVVANLGLKQQQQEAASTKVNNVGPLLSDLKSCSKAKNLEWGRKIHAQLLESGNDSSIHVSAALVHMYAKCGSMVDARRVFDRIGQPNVVLWTTLLLGYADNGEAITALDLFSKMKSQGCAPNSITYVAALKACTSLAQNEGGSRREECLEWGKQIHLETKQHLNLYVENKLIDMYAKCGSMVLARQVFDSLRQPDVISWNVLILGYAENGEALTALELFSRMKTQGCAPNSVTYVAALKACTSLALKEGGSGRKECLERGKQIHSEIQCDLDLSVQNTLMDMYAKCGSMVEARQVFDSIRHPDVISWNILLLGYGENGEGATALELFSRMKPQGCAPNSATYLALLKTCTSLAQKDDGSRKAECLERGKHIHSEIGCSLDFFLQNALIDMYAKCGSMVHAHDVFHGIRAPDVVSWTSLISGYAENGEGRTALRLFSEMKSHGCTPDSLTYMAVLKACISLAQSGPRLEALEWGKQIHLAIGTSMDHYLQRTLIDMYTKSGSMVDAHEVFDTIRHPDVVSWNVLLLGYAENGHGLSALELFSRMKLHGCAPNSITYVAVLKACASLATKEDGSRLGECLKRGKQIHEEIGSHLNIYLQNSLIDMYGKCGSMVDARQVFDSMEYPDVMSWNALLLGYAENGEGLTALNLFSMMKSHGWEPNSITFMAALKACGFLGALEYGRKLHAAIDEFNANLVTCLVDFYAKCGSLVEAQEVFDSHPKARDLTTWTALLAGYSSFGETNCVFRLFQQMQDAGFQPDGVAYLCALMCCSHAGLVERARECFETMCANLRLAPSVKHYNCMLDVLGRANKLDDAIVTLRRMPCRPNAVTWTSVLGACRKWKNVEIGRLAFQSLVSLDEGDAAAYAVMAQIYASRGMWKEQEAVLEMRKNFQDSQVPGQAWWASEAGEVHVLSAPFWDSGDGQQNGSTDIEGE